MRKVYVIKSPFTGHWRAWDSLVKGAYSVDGSAGEYKRPVRMLDTERETFAWMEGRGQSSTSDPSKLYLIQAPSSLQDRMGKWEQDRARGINAGLLSPAEYARGTAVLFRALERGGW